MLLETIGNATQIGSQENEKTGCMWTSLCQCADGKMDHKQGVAKKSRQPVSASSGAGSKAETKTTNKPAEKKAKGKPFSMLMS